MILAGFPARFLAANLSEAEQRVHSRLSQPQLRL